MSDGEKKKLLDRRTFVAGGVLGAAAAPLLGPERAAADDPQQAAIVQPPSGKSILLSCKLTMIAKQSNGVPLTLVQRLKMAVEAGFDGVDFDEAGDYSVQQARAAVQESGVFVHNAINHAHWDQRLTSANSEQRARGRANIEHCLRLSHAAGGSGVLIVIGRGDDGDEAEIIERCRGEIRSLIPLAASLGQPILIENVWNRMMYDHDAGPEQTADRFIEFIDSFHSRWVGLYYDIGNHWKYGQPGEWIRALGPRCVKLDVKGFSRQWDKFTDIGEGDLPWDQVRGALADIGFAGWATAEVRGGDVERLTTVRRQMESVFGIA